MRESLFIIFIVLFCGFDIYANNAAVVIDSITIIGNKKTKRQIMLRELTFSKGDSVSLSMLSSVLEQNRLRLMNTNLFLNAKMNVKNWTENNHVIVQIDVTENWFLFPIPIFEIADRNFNVWWKEQNHSLKRTNYGMRLTYNNLTGRRDPLSATVQLGYTPKYSFSYSLPYINKKQTIGFSASYFNAVNREVGYATDSNKISFYRDANKFLLNRTGFSVGISHTPKLLTRFSATVGYTKNRVDSAVVQTLNRDYYLDGQTQQHYFWLAVGCSYDSRDIRPYPMHGDYFSLNFNKTGLLSSDNVNTLDVSSKLAHYFSFSSKLSLEAIVKGKTALIRAKPPYTNVRGLGYGSDNLRGYEFYVVDGLDYFYSKNSFRVELLNRSFDLNKWVKMKLLKNWLDLPLKTYLTFNFDTGYVNNPFEKESNKLSNRQLYGGGVGLDIIAYYNMTWRFEYSMNHLGEKGLFFNYSVGF
jgi:outer membrane protein assembly factor BamA